MGVDNDVVFEIMDWLGGYSSEGTHIADLNWSSLDSLVSYIKTDILQGEYIDEFDDFIERKIDDWYSRGYMFSMDARGEFEEWLEAHADFWEAGNDANNWVEYFIETSNKERFETELDDAIYILDATVSPKSWDFIGMGSRSVYMKFVVYFNS